MAAVQTGSKVKILESYKAKNGTGAERETTIYGYNNENNGNGFGHTPMTIPIFTVTVNPLEADEMTYVPGNIYYYSVEVEFVGQIAHPLQMVHVWVAIYISLNTLSK